MGYFFALLASLLFGLNGSTTKVLVEAGLSPAQLTFARVTIIMLLAGGALLLTDRAQFRASPAQLGVLAVLGVAGVALTQWFYALAISLLPVGIALMLEYSAVLFVALTARFLFRERVKPRIWVAIGAVLVGMMIVAQVWASPLSGLGVVAGLLAAVCMSAYFLLGERQVASASPLSVTFWSMLFASAFWLLFSAWWEVDPTLLTGQATLGGNLDAVTLPLWLVLLWNGVLGSFAPYLLSYMALRRLTASAAGIVSASEVLFAFGFAFLWLGETLSTVQMFGAALVLIGIVVAQTARANKAIDLDLASQDFALAKGPVR